MVDYTKDEKPIEKFDHWLIRNKVRIFVSMILILIFIFFWIPNRPGFLKVKSDTYILKTGQDSIKYLMIAEFKKINERLDVYDSDIKRIPKIFPAPGSKITSRYEDIRLNSKGDTVKHWALDISNKKGSPIYSPISGVIIKAKWDDGFGNCYILDSGLFKVLIAHIDSMLFKVNDIVTQGQKIATVGSTGTSTGPHEHIEIEQNNKRVDPFKFVL